MIKTEVALVIAVNILATFGLTEATVRLMHRGSPSYSEYTGQAGDGYYASSKTNTFTLKKSFSGWHQNQDRYLDNEPFRVPVNTDAQGFRLTIKPNKQCSNHKKLLILGDSYTFGYSLRDEDTVASAIQKLANTSNKCIVVINAGYADGYETDQIHSWLYQNIARIKPDYVLYNVFSGNDIHGIDQTAWKDLTSNGLPRQWISPSIYVENGFIKETHGTPPLYLYYVPLVRESKTLATVESMLRILVRKFGIDLRAGFQEDLLGHMYGDYSDKFISKERIFLKLIESMNNLAIANNAKFYISYMPANFEVYPELVEKILPGSRRYNRNATPTNYGSRLCDLVSAIGIQCLNLTTSMQKDIANKNIKHAQLLKENYFYPVHGEIHMSKSGASFSGEQIYNRFFNNKLP